MRQGGEGSPKEVRKYWSKWGTVTVEGVGSRRPSDPTPMEIDRSLNRNPKFVGVHTALPRRILGAFAGKVITEIRKFPSGPGFEQTGTSGDDYVARQSALAGDSLDDE